MKVDSLQKLLILQNCVVNKRMWRDAGNCNILSRTWTDGWTYAKYFIVSYAICICGV